MGFWCDLWAGFLSTFIGGLIITLVLFLFKERVFPLPELSGKWYFEVKTTETEYKKFDKMVLFYEAYIWQEGPYLKGTVEKYYERSLSGNRKYIGKNRTRGNLRGYVEKKYLGTDVIFIHITEKGHGREYTHIYKLEKKKCIQKSHYFKLVGSFDVSAAGQRGDSIWQRSAFIN